MTHINGRNFVKSTMGAGLSVAGLMSLARPMNAFGSEPLAKKIGLQLYTVRDQMEIDLYWTIKAGVDMSKYYRQYPGRFPMCHIKDIDVDGNYEDLGKGKIDFNKLLADRDIAGFKHYFVENGAPKDSMKTIQIGYDFVKNL